MGCSQSMVSEHALERRTDPWDGNTESLEEMVKKYEGTYSKAEVESYFEFECTAVPAPAKVQENSDDILQEPKDLPAEMPSIALERRIDPWDGKTESLEEMVKKYQGTYSKAEVESYFEFDCTVPSVPAPAKVTPAPALAASNRLTLPGIVPRHLLVFNGEKDAGRLDESPGPETGIKWTFDGSNGSKKVPAGCINVGLLAKETGDKRLLRIFEARYRRLHDSLRKCRLALYLNHQAPETPEDNAEPGDADASKTATPFLVEELTEEGVKIAHESICARSVKELQQEQFRSEQAVVVQLRQRDAAQGRQTEDAAFARRLEEDLREQLRKMQEMEEDLRAQLGKMEAGASDHATVAEDLRTQLRKMEAGASDKDKVEEDLRAQLGKMEAGASDHETVVEDLRTQLRKMEAGASDKDKVEGRQTEDAAFARRLEDLQEELQLERRRAEMEQSELQELAALREELECKQAEERSAVSRDRSEAEEQLLAEELFATKASQDLVEQFTEEPGWPEWLFCCLSRPSKQLEVVKMDEPKEVSVAKVVEVEPADDSDSSEKAKKKSSDSSDSEKKPKKKANSDSSSDERRKRKKSDSSDDGAKKKAKVKAKNSSSSEARKDSSDDEEEKAKKDDSSDDEKKKAKKDSSDDEKEKAKKDSSDEEEKKKELLRPKSDMAPSEALEEPQWPWFEWLQLPGLSWIF